MMNEQTATNGAVSVPSNNGELLPQPTAVNRHRLTETQRQFFQRQKQALTNIEMGLRGALQMLVEEKSLIGKVSLSEDCAELIQEE